MSLNVNNVTLAGNLTRDPELRQISPDRVVANFGLAVNRRWKNPAGEQVEEATFVDVEAWGRTAELVGQYLKKGSPAYLEGRLKLDAWEDDAGQKRSRIKIVAERVQFLSSRERSDGAERAEAGERTEAAAAPNPSPAGPRRAAAPRRTPAQPPVPDEAPF